jgi:ribosomal protein L32
MPHALSTESDTKGVFRSRKSKKKKDQRRNNEDQKEKQLSTKHCTENKISSNMNLTQNAGCYFR